MRRFTIEVDPEVFAYLEAEARARIETHNTVLRRKLLGEKPNAALPPLLRLQGPGRKALHQASSTTQGLPALPPSIPSALQQILWVVHLVRANGRARTEATGDVARILHVVPQTVNDKYGRQLGLTAEEFDALLREASLQQLEELLTERFPSYRDAIHRVLSALRPAA